MAFIKTFLRLGGEGESERGAAIAVKPGGRQSPHAINPFSATDRIGKKKSATKTEKLARPSGGPGRQTHWTNLRTPTKRRMQMTGEQAFPISDKKRGGTIR